MRDIGNDVSLPEHLLLEGSNIGRTEMIVHKLHSLLQGRFAIDDRDPEEHMCPMFKDIFVDDGIEFIEECDGIEFAALEPVAA